MDLKRNRLRSMTISVIHTLKYRHVTQSIRLVYWLKNVSDMLLLLLVQKNDLVYGAFLSVRNNLVALPDHVNSTGLLRGLRTAVALFWMAVMLLI